MTLAELIIKLSADTAVLRNDFAKGKQYAQDFAADVSKAFSTIGTALAGLSGLAITKEIFDFTKASADYADEIGRASEQTGMAVQEISALRFAAKSSDVDLEGLVKSIGIFDKNLVGLSGSGGKFAALLGQIGIQAKDTNGNLLPAHELLLKVAGVFAHMPDGAEKSALALKLFGKSGEELIPLLDRGADGITALEARARALGVVLSDEDVSAARLAHQEFINLDTGIKGLEMDLGKSLFPTLILGAELLLRNKYAAAEFKDEIALLDLGLTAQMLSATNLFGMNNAALDETAKQATDIVTDQHRQMDDLNKELAKLGESTHPLLTGIPDLHSGGAAGGGAEKEKGLSTLTQDMEAFGRSQQEVNRLIHECETFVTPLNKAWQEYDERLIRIMELPQGIDEGPLRMMNAMKLGSDMDKLYDSNSAEALAGSQRNAQMSRSAGLADMSKLTVQATNGLQQVHEAFATLDADAYEFGQKASTDFTKLLMTGQGLEKSLRSLIDLFGEFILKTVVFQQLSQAFGQSGKSPLGVIGSFFAGLAGGRASGGDVSSGSSYVVGEQGPEIFTPTTAGSITPNDQIGDGGGKGGHSFNIDARGADAGVEYRVQRGIVAGMKQAAINGYMMTQEMAKRGA